MPFNPLRRTGRLHGERYAFFKTYFFQLVSLQREPTTSETIVVRSPRRMTSRHRTDPSAAEGFGVLHNPERAEVEYDSQRSERRRNDA